MSDEPQPKAINGPRNLAILAIAAMVLAVISTCISVYIYQASGDIYIDRSRPGFLPDKKEQEQNSKDEKYLFPDDGPVNDKVIDEYLKHLKTAGKPLQSVLDAFSEDALSDSALGIED